uniref:Carcinoembryonic antigen-related cell adhesion molecule 5-like n=1 Tax=Sphaeramia orbicularis TaxID=375764 RepID=A0A673CQM5_9TELE
FTHYIYSRSTMTIVSVTRYDQGPFRCFAFNLVSDGTSDPVTFTISCELLTYTLSILTVSVCMETLGFQCCYCHDTVTREIITQNLFCQIVIFLNLEISPESLGQMNPLDNKQHVSEILLVLCTGISSKITMNGPENVILRVSPSQKYHPEGSDVALSCSAVSEPTAEFTWFCNGVLQSGTGPEFRLMNIQMNHSGSYSCQAFNSKTMRTETSQPLLISVLSKFVLKNLIDFDVKL